MANWDYAQLHANLQEEAEKVFPSWRRLAPNFNAIPTSGAETSQSDPRSAHDVGSVATIRPECRAATPSKR